MHDDDLTQRRTCAVDGLDSLGVNVAVVKKVSEGHKSVEQQAGEEERSQAESARAIEAIGCRREHAGTGAEECEVALTLGAHVQCVLLEIKERRTQARRNEEERCDKRRRPQGSGVNHGTKLLAHALEYSRPCRLTIGLTHQPP